VLSLGILFPSAIGMALLMWLATFVGVVRLVRHAPLPPGAPPWARPLVFSLYLAQPIVRGWHRHRHVLLNKRLRPLPEGCRDADRQVKKINALQIDLYWNSDQGRGRERLL